LQDQLTASRAGVATGCPREETRDQCAGKNHFLEVKVALEGL
jgi:hypothetical protein